MVCRSVVVGLCALVLAVGCSKKAEQAEQGSAPPPVKSVKPGACAAGGAAVSDALSASWFPRLAGSYCVDPNGEAHAYGEQAKGTLDSVCTELLDGECEVYKQHGLKRVVTLRYIDGSGTPGTVNVIASRFASSEGAFTFFTKRVIAGGDPLESTTRELGAGASAALGSGIAYVWRGDVVAELSYTNEDETPDQIRASSAKALPELAKKIGEQIPGDVKPLPAVALLPEEGRVAMGVGYAHRDVLGVTGLGAGAIGYYQAGDRRYRVVTLAREDEDAAKDVLGTLKKLPGSATQKDLGFDAVVFATRDGEGAPQANWLAGRRGASVFIVGDEPLALASGADSKGRLASDERLQRLKAAMSGKPAGKSKD